ncbi:acetoin ABC transporter ATP-binding protein [Leuconostoc litchii]|uniref:ABC transporter ATP-binding protein n=1 Tax=Leuconostoc litchii TaxID=1981069 RepID=A0A6P2CMQ1_9LACO|nr:ABC transporter ATP-binding protein [Leuconostoc litchii]TYC46225.1 ABC transporter ATP-binding protein [Leuconostoc litchii]GMA69929.1 acetoin ABC transporter ATP-binding protein [Leuconostoc litchii]
MSLILENISKKINHHAILNNVSFELNEGEVVGLVGRNGAGKTTLFRMLSGEVQPDFGRIGLDDRDYIKTTASHDQMFYVDMPDNWLAFYTPKRIKSILEVAYIKFDSDWYDEKLKQFNLNNNSRIQNYSKGMKALFTIIVSFASRAQYVLLDEPLDGLDVLVRDQVKQLIIDRVTKNNTTVLIASHNLIELDMLVDRILLLKDGTIDRTFAIEHNKNIKKYQLAFEGDAMPDFLRNNGTIIAQVGHIVTIVFDNFDEEIGIKLAGSDFKFIEELPISSEDIFRASFANEVSAWQQVIGGEA